MKLFINNGLIVDPENHLASLGNLVIEDGIITEMNIGEDKKPASDQKKDDNDVVTLDAKGKWIVPGLIDLHVHLREPGFEHKENIESGCRAAEKGGFTTICCMPNTKPVIDHKEVVAFIDKKAKDVSGIHVLSVGAITKGQEGNQLADYQALISVDTKAKAMMKTGICGISEDGKTVENEELMLQAMKQAKDCGLTVFSHAEPEAAVVKRDLRLAEVAGCRLHFCHISQKESIELIREAKKRGVPVTAETAPHYFTLDSSQVKDDTNKKMNPPLRTKEDVKAVIDAMKDGTIDVIATDHAPHHESDKTVPFEAAANGVIGLETSFPVSYTKLVKTGILTPLELISKMSTKPAEILGIERGSLWIGRAADIAIIDVDQEYEICRENFRSKGKNSPFLGMKVFGKVMCTIADGKIIWEEKE